MQKVQNRTAAASWVFPARAFTSLTSVLAVLLFCTNAWAEMRSVRVKTANFREAPSDIADVLFTADRHYPVKILERKRGWARVKDFEGEVAWVAERLLGTQKSVVIVVEKTTARDKPEPNGAPVFDAVWSEAYAVKQTRAGWVLVESADGKEGWVSRDVTWGFEP
jgi:SH3-like domain-containing protein